MFSAQDECEFLRTFRGFTVRAATARFAQRRIFCRSRVFATVRLSCAFVVVRQSLAESLVSHRRVEHANERPVLKDNEKWWLGDGPLMLPGTGSEPKPASRPFDHDSG